MVLVEDHSSIQNTHLMHWVFLEQLPSRIYHDLHLHPCIEAFDGNGDSEVFQHPMNEGPASQPSEHKVSKLDCLPPTTEQADVQRDTAENSSWPGSDPPSRPTHQIAFHRWVNTIRKRAVHHVAHHDEKKHVQDTVGARRGHRESSSESSMGLVRAVRTASGSIASFSIAARSRRNTLQSRPRSRTEASSRASCAVGRLSEDAGASDSVAMPDLPALHRSLQRRRILEELIRTEESYIGDLRFLANVYITTLASLPTLSAGLRTSINHNLTQIIQLHDEILGNLHRVIPHSEYTQVPMDAPTALDKICEEQSNPSPANPHHHHHHHHRWRSFDTTAEQQKGETWLPHKPGVFADPQVVAEVAKVFGHNLSRFFIYQEYSAKYELMKRDAQTALDLVPVWTNHERGLETLASMVGPVRNVGADTRKSLSVGDLLVKPVQRICKYPLLFAELLKYTPEEDCANSHMKIEDILFRMREATAEINHATSDPRMKTVLEKTWLLQDRLMFRDRKFDSVSKNQIRSLGRVIMCGALYVCWQTGDGVDGQYLVCALYQDVLCLASVGKVEPIYTIVACIRLSDARVTEVDNGLAPYSWKLVFESDGRLYELMMTACTPKEELEWRARLKQRGEKPTSTINETLPTSIDPRIKSISASVGRSGRGPVHRATISETRLPLCQIVLKNTSAEKDANTLRKGIHRSQSLLATTSRIPVLAPPRSERSRLETLMEDVWSRDILQFPVMSGRSRSESLVRSSASTMMRKLSGAGLSNTLSKRSRSAQTTSRRTASAGKEPMDHNDALVQPGRDAFERASARLRRDERGESSDQSDVLPWKLPSGNLQMSSAQRQDQKPAKRWNSTDQTKTDTTDEGTIPTTVASDTVPISPTSSQGKKSDGHAEIVEGNDTQCDNGQTVDSRDRPRGLSGLMYRESRRELRNRGLSRFFRPQNS